MNLTYVALDRVKHGDKVYEPGSDISHFAPLMPNLVSAVSVGQVQLVDPDGVATRPRLEVRTSPYLYGLLTEDVRHAHQDAQGVDTGSDSAAETPFSDEPPEPDVTEEPTGDAESLFDPAEYTIAEVLAHVEEHPDSLAQVMIDEAQGKNRVTLMKTLDELSQDD
jgi:hypothetical protein